MSRVENWTRKEREKQTCHHRHGQSDFSCLRLWRFSLPFRDELTIVVRPPGTCSNSGEKLSNKSHVIDLLEKFVCLAFVSLLRMFQDGKSLKGVVRWMRLFWVKDLKWVLIAEKIVLSTEKNASVHFRIRGKLRVQDTVFKSNISIHFEQNIKAFFKVPQINKWRHSTANPSLTKKFPISLN